MSNPIETTEGGEHPLTVFMYPGQGSLEPGKIKKVTNRILKSRELFEEATGYANEKLALDLGKMMLEGGKTIIDGVEVDINDTRLAQPATLIESIVGSTALKEILGRDADIRAPHSFGHIAAFHDRGVFDTPTAIDFAIERGAFMYQDSLDQPGSMAAIFGVAEERVVALCKKWGVWFGVDNSHTEIVISGEEDKVDAAVAEIAAEVEENGGRKPIKLKVQAAAHSPLVEAAGAKMAKTFDNLQSKIHVPKSIAVVSSRTTQIMQNLHDIRADIAGLPDMVRWRNTVINLLDDGFVEFYETGPGSKLSRLPRRDPIMQSYLTEKQAFMMSLDQLLDKQAS